MPCAHAVCDLAELSGLETDLLPITGAILIERLAELLDQRVA
jgi:hypothetical protein